MSLNKAPSSGSRELCLRNKPTIPHIGMFLIMKLLYLKQNIAKCRKLSLGSPSRCPYRSTNHSPLFLSTHLLLFLVVGRPVLDRRDGFVAYPPFTNHRSPITLPHPPGALAQSAATAESFTMLPFAHSRLR